MIALFVFELRGAAWTLFIVGSLLDRFFGEPIEPVADGLLDDIMAFSKSR